MKEKGFILLETDRLILRDHVAADLESHHLLLSDKKVMFYLQDIMSESMEQSTANLGLVMSGMGTPSRRMYNFRMELKETGEHVGEVGYNVTEFTDVGKLGQLGYFSHTKFWGHGYMTEAVRRLLKFAFEENGVFRISTGCVKENLGSEHVMQKCGMIKEADMRLKEWSGGMMHDRVEYRLLKDEWRFANNQYNAVKK